MRGLSTVDELSRVQRGTYVRVRGTLRAATPIEAPFGDEMLAGYDIACAVFSASRDRFGRVQRPAVFEETLYARRWSEAWLSDETGEIALDLHGSRVKAPAGAERTLISTADIQRAVRWLSLELPFVPAELQLTERLVPHEREATVTGFVDVRGGGGFRVSARQQRVLRGDRLRPLVIVPR